MRKEVFEEVLLAVTGKYYNIESVSAISGGSINSAACLKCRNDLFFVKWNDAAAYPGMFNAESKGLSLLSETHTVRIPEVIGICEVQGSSFLVLEYIVPGRKSEDFFKDLGFGLATLHKSSSNKTFGLDHSNFIGSLPLQNTAHQSWSEFFIEERLKPLVDLARETRLVDSSVIGLFEKFYSELASLIPEEKPMLVHGDLWSGNFLSDENGAPVLIDPAVYYGSREMDIAMSKLFGGFEQSFYDSYNEAFPLQAGWKERIRIHNLYPLLVHLNLFGEAYLPDILQTLRYFAG